MMTADRRLIRTAIHELSHAIVGRHLGTTILTVDVTHSGAAPGTGSSGCVRVGEGAGHGPFGDAMDSATHLFAGYAGAELLTVLALEMYPDPLPGEDQPPALIEAAIGALPERQAEQAIERQADESTEVAATDYEQARWWIRLVAPGDDFWPALDFAQQRARRLCAELAPLILGLIPAILARPIMSGPDLEAAIQALELEKEQAP